MQQEEEWQSAAALGSHYEGIWHSWELWVFEVLSVGNLWQIGAGLNCVDRHEELLSSSPSPRLAPLNKPQKREKCWVEQGDRANPSKNQRISATTPNWRLPITKGPSLCGRLIFPIYFINFPLIFLWLDVVRENKFPRSEGSSRSSESHLLYPRGVWVSCISRSGFVGQKY